MLTMIFVSVCFDTINFVGIIVNLVTFSTSTRLVPLSRAFFFSFVLKTQNEVLGKLSSSIKTKPLFD